MKQQHLTYLEAVISLHERGFTEDFVQSGERLFWIQQQAWLPAKDYRVLERHYFHLPRAKIYMVLAIVTKSAWAKGILILQQQVGQKAVPANATKAIGQRWPSFSRSNKTTLQ